MLHKRNIKPCKDIATTSHTWVRARHSSPLQLVTHPSNLQPVTKHEGDVPRKLSNRMLSEIHVLESASEDYGAALQRPSSNLSSQPCLMRVRPLSFPRLVWTKTSDVSKEGCL